MTRLLIPAALSLVLLGCNDDASSKKGELRITVSAEGLGANGYAFPPGAGQELAFVDGWEVTFDRILVAIGNIRISEAPDTNPGDQGKTGSTVVERRATYVLDLKRAGTDLDKGGAGKVAIRLPIDDMKGLFELEQRYAFSYALVPASVDAKLVNLEPDDPDLISMIASQQRVLLVGTARFRGVSCSASAADYDFTTLPQTVGFRFGLPGSVSYVNCQNPDNAGSPIEGEESQRGIQLLPNATTVAQITIHTDHLFWPTTAHENLPLFDQFASNAKASANSDGVYSLTLDDLATVPVPSLTDARGKPIPWRSCVSSALYVLPSQPPSMTFDSGSQGFSNLRDFVSFNARTMSHLNADGLCYVQ